MAPRLVFALSSLFILALPAKALACACCAADNTWAIGTYSFEDSWGFTLQDYNFANPVFEDAPAYEETYSAAPAKFSDNRLKFSGPSFEAVFVVSGNGTHSRRDISFATARSSEAVDEAVILHELILPGRLTISGTPRSNIETAALLIMQGTGNNCFEPQTLTKWILKVQDQPSSAPAPPLTGSGSLIADPASPQHKE